MNSCFLVAMCCFVTLTLASCKPSKDSDLSQSPQEKEASYQTGTGTVAIRECQFSCSTYGARNEPSVSFSCHVYVNERKAGVTEGNCTCVKNNYRNESCEILTQDEDGNWANPKKWIDERPWNNSRKWVNRGQCAEYVASESYFRWGSKRLQYDCDPTAKDYVLSKNGPIPEIRDHHQPSFIVKPDINNLPAAPDNRP